MTFATATFCRVMPRLSKADAARYIGPLDAALEEFFIVTPQRVAAFLAQLAHESAELRYWEEIWGPTPAQKRYEGRADLGNTEPGDGYRYRGRGPIQLTGRANYRRYGKALFVLLEENPDLATIPLVGFRIAGMYWRDHGCNELADAEDFTRITQKINGGLNGLKDRQVHYARACAVLGA